MSILTKLRCQSFAQIDWLVPTIQGKVVIETPQRRYTFVGFGQAVPLPRNSYMDYLQRYVQASYRGKVSSEELLNAILRSLNENYFYLLYHPEYCNYIFPNGSICQHFIPGHVFGNFPPFPISRFAADPDAPRGEQKLPKDFVNYGPDPDSVPPNTPVVYILGAEPSYAELVHGLNFAGDFGDLLLETFREYLVWDVEPYFYVANTIRTPEYPKSCKAKILKDHLPLIQMELAILRPNHIICIGSQALKCFTKKSQNALRDRPEPCTYLTVEDDGTVMQREALVHALPLSALQSLSDAQIFHNQAKKVYQIICTGQRPEHPRIEYQRIDSIHQLREYLQPFLDRSRLTTIPIAVDLEWNGRFPTEKNVYVRTINLCYNLDGRYYPAVVVLTAPGGEWIFDGLPEELVEVLGLIFSPRSNTQIVGHNFLADIPYLEFLGISAKDKYQFPDLDCQDPNYPGVFDTIIAYHAVDECGQFSLDAAANVWLDFPDWTFDISSWLKEHKELAQDGYGMVPEEILLPYAAVDAYVTLRLSEELKKHLFSDRFHNNCWRPYWINLRAQPAFLEMYLTGIPIDQKRAYELAQIYHAKRDELLKQFRDLIKWPTFNFQSYPQCVELLYGEAYSGKRVRPEGAISFYMKPIRTTDGQDWQPHFQPGRVSPSTDLETLQALAIQEPRIKLLRNIRILNQVIKTVLPDPDDEEEVDGILKYLCADGRIHPFYSPLKETRRCSSSKPNMQNLPNAEEENYASILGDQYLAPIRSIIVAPEGYTIVEIDYTGAELLLIGVAAADENLISDYYRTALPDDDPNKLDIHSNIAVLAFHLDCPPTKSGLKSIGKINYRMAAKRIIFGLNYGRSVHSCYTQLALEGVDITEADVQRIVDTIYERYSNVKVLQDETRRRVHTHRWLANCFGSYRRFPPTRARDQLAKMEREAINFICQSGVADAVSIAMYNFFHHPARKEVNYRFLMHNHDALVFLVPDENVERFSKEVVIDCMKNGVKFKSCTLDGIPRPSSPDYHFELEIKSCKRWSE